MLRGFYDNGTKVAMKIALFGIAEIKHGKHNLKDRRLKQADKLVAANKKTHAQVDVVGKDHLLQADVILVLDASHEVIARHV